MRKRAPSRTLSLEVMESRSLLATLLVTSGDDSGPGTLRAAIETANTNGSSNTIVIRNAVAAIELESSLIYGSDKKLSIQGGGATIQPASGFEGDFDLLVSSGGASLSLTRLTFTEGANGVYAPVPQDAEGTITFTLDRVNLVDNTTFGLWVDDQAGQGGDGANSDASIRLEARAVTATGNGFLASDLDGIRVDEGGVGDIWARLQNVTITDNGADGLELDERGEGGVNLTALQSAFDLNGPKDPADLDDGIDIDEAGGGSIRVKLSDVTINGNFDEGLDLTEDGDGDIIAQLARVQANDNNDEGIKFEEIGNGNIQVFMLHVEASSTNDEEGIVIEETGAGNLNASLNRVTANDNAKDGIDLSEEGDGTFRLSLINVTTRNNAGDGVKIEEAGAGNLLMAAINLTSEDNDEDGLQAEQESLGLDTGVLLLVSAMLAGNATDLDTNGVSVTEV